MKAAGDRSIRGGDVAQTPRLVGAHDGLHMRALFLGDITRAGFLPFLRAHAQNLGGRNVAPEQFDQTFLGVLALDFRLGLVAGGSPGHQGTAFFQT